MLNPLNDESNRNIAELVVLILTVVARDVVAAVQRYFGRRRHRHASLEVMNDHDVGIDRALDAALYSTSASRVYVSLFRNGATFDSGNPLMRKCRTHERCRNGVSPQSLDYREMPTSRVPDELALVRADGHSFTPVADLPHGHFRSLCEIEGTVAVARVALRRGSDLVGFVGADYGSAAEPPNMAELEKAAGIVSLELASTAKPKP